MHIRKHLANNDFTKEVETGLAGVVKCGGEVISSLFLDFEIFAFLGVAKCASQETFAARFGQCNPGKSAERNHI